MKIIPRSEYEMIRARYLAGETTTQIGRTYSCVSGAIWNVLNRMGVQIRRAHLGQLQLGGQRFGQLVADRLVVKENHRARLWWVCKCDCGNTTTVRQHSLVRGHTRSCGCRRVAASRENGLKAKKHGYARHGAYHPLYSTWTAIIARCTSPASKQYPNYGGRGIGVCERWRKDFTAFLADVGPRPSGHTLDRIDNDGNYEPGNVRWATPKQQAANSRNWLYLEDMVRHLVELSPTRMHGDECDYCKHARWLSRRRNVA